MNSREVHVELWDEFERRLDSYFRLTAIRRNQFVFRGHGNAAWDLTATIDRGSLQRPSRQDREILLRRLLDQFRRQCVGLASSNDLPDTPRQWELLGRHHGLPTTILGWTTSPYVAAYFAFRHAVPGGRVAIWILDRKLFVDRDSQASQGVGRDDPLEFLDDIDDYRFNVRAVEQHAVFMKVHDPDFVSDPFVSQYLIKYTLPSSERSRVLTRLQARKIDGRSLFRDLDHAAETASLRIDME